MMLRELFPLPRNAQVSSSWTDIVTVSRGRMVAYGANWVNEPQKNLIKLWDSADWGINYMHAKFNILTPFNNRLFVPCYDGRILVMG